MPLTLTVDLPGEAEQRIRATNPDVPAYAREALAIQLFRADKLTHYELGQMLGLDRIETDGLLKRHGVENPLTHEDVAREVADYERLRGRSQ